jgi:hypothetical protein
LILLLFKTSSKEKIMQKEDIKTNLLVHPEGGAHSGKTDALKSNSGGAAGAFLP